MDVRDLVDGAYREIVEAAAARESDWNDPPAVRARARELFPPAAIPEGVEVEDHEVPGPPGAPSVIVRVYRPADAAAEPLPCVYWIHGGGYMVGTYDGDNEMASRYSTSAAPSPRSSTGWRPSTPTRRPRRTATRASAG